MIQHVSLLFWNILPKDLLVETELQDKKRAVVSVVGILVEITQNEYLFLVVGKRKDVTYVPVSR